VHKYGIIDNWPRIAANAAPGESAEILAMIVSPSLAEYFTGSHAFVAQHGDEVWQELCDLQPFSYQFRPCDAAPRLRSLAHYKNKTARLLAVLHAIIADFKDRPDAYENRCPITVHGRNLSRISI